LADFGTQTPDQRWAPAPRGGTRVELQESVVVRGVDTVDHFIALNGSCFEEVHLEPTREESASDSTQNEFSLRSTREHLITA
jgi:hypothetical protein